MRALLILFGLLLCSSLHAGPTYSSSRRWVEDRCTTNQAAKEERIFLLRVVPKEYAAILSYRQGISIREVIDQTPFKGTTVIVCIMRSNVPPSDFVWVQPTETPKIEVKNMDVIWLCDSRSPIKW